jgi:hypothetical protein
MPNHQISASEETREKAVYDSMTDRQKLEFVTQLTDQVLAELTSAFLEVVKKERWGKRDLAYISGLNETGIGHILSGRRKNLTIETIALLARAMRKRPELVLRDLRPRGNSAAATSAADAVPEQQIPQAHLRPALRPRAAGESAVRMLEAAE